MQLVIVESPTKSKTISKFLGKDFVIRASVGHIRDLPKSNKKAIDIEGGFVPNYVVDADKKDIISDLAFGFQSEFVKFGALGKGRDEKLNRLIEIERSLG